jgi:hypothetical protein
MAPPEAAIAPEHWNQARAVADAVLYEGYILYPYRASSGKNRIRWQFGVLAPRAWVEAHDQPDDTSTITGASESWFQQLECLLETKPDSVIRVAFRFLHVSRRSVEAAHGNGGFFPVESLDVGDMAYLQFDEARPREFTAEVPLAKLLSEEQELTFEAPATRETELITDSSGNAVGRLVHATLPVPVVIRVSAETAPAPFSLVRLRMRLENTATDVDVEMPREEVLRHCLVAAHTLLGVAQGRFLSLLDPPHWAEAAAKGCRNLRTFPVLAGPPGGQRLLLASPIILYDYPAIAPESPADLFDATEIDEILTLRTMTLTDAEKREARATDPRSAAIVDRVSPLDAGEQEWFARLHGAIRSLRPVQADSDRVTVNGVTISEGSRVRLHPRQHGTDAQDLFLSGRTARVAAVMEDMEGQPSLAVTLEEDPGAELNEWYGRFRYFNLDEVEPLEPPG